MRYKVSEPQDKRGRRRTGRGSKSKRHAGVHEVVGLVYELFPEGIVELPYDFDELDIETKSVDLTNRLRGIEEAELLYQQEPRGGPVWDDEDPEEDAPTDFEHTRSYLLMFLALRGELFRYDLAPVAIVKFGEMEFPTLAEADWVGHYRSPMLHKRGNPKSTRAGCLPCKPHKHQAGKHRARTRQKRESDWHIEQWRVTADSRDQ